MHMEDRGPRLQLATLAAGFVFAFAAGAGAQEIKGHWEASTAFPMPMEEPVGAVVDGKLYVIQGLTEGGFQPMGVVYVFDPATKAWTKKSPMPEPHVHHAMTAAVNGKIYVFGGFSRPGKDLAWQPVDNAWEYAPDTDTWRAIAPLPSKRGAGSAVVVNGKVYVIGGATVLPGQSDPAIRFDGKPHDMCVGTNEEYDPATNTWPPAPRYRPPATTSLAPR
jgi:N-acetylneuraminic acid mutarotase